MQVKQHNLFTVTAGSRNKALRLVPSSKHMRNSTEIHSNVKNGIKIHNYVRNNTEIHSWDISLKALFNKRRR